MKSLFLLSLYLCLFNNILTYNAIAAVRYAKNWWNRRNPNNFDCLDYDDCNDSANFVSQCLIAGGFSTSGCEMALGRGGTYLNVVTLEKCLKQKGWNSSNKVPSGGFPVGGVITFNNGQHASICVKGGNVPLIANHSPNEWMGSSNWGWARNYYWFGKSSSDSVTIN